MRSLFVAAAVAVCPTAALAAPAYLTCQLPKRDGSVLEVKITADENAGQVTVVIPETGLSERVPAVFSPSSVSWGLYSDFRYELSRVDLSITRVFSISGAERSRDAGVCELEPAPKRAF